MSKKEQYTVQDIIQMIDISVQKFMPKWATAEENKRRWFAKNWTPEMEQQHRDQGGCFVKTASNKQR